jgi:outer membrane protein assembly factor BamB
MNRSHIRLYLIVSAVLALAAVSSCSGTKNRAPAVPGAPTGPEYCAKDTVYTYMAAATDPEGDSVAIRFDWGDSTLSTWSGWFASGETIALTHAWSDTGTYLVRAWAQDPDHAASDLSAGLSVVVVLSPDAPSEPAGPDQGATDSSYTFASVAFQPDNFNVAVRFAWGDGDTSEWSSFVASGESVGLSHTWPDTGTYSIRTQARDTGTGRSQWSPAHDIVIHPPDTLIKWRLRLDASAELSPAIGPDGAIYVGAADSSLYAVNPDGTLKWRYQTGGNVQSSPALAADGTVYFWSEDNYFYAVDSGGNLKWRYFLNWGVTSCPAVAADGTIYLGSYDSYLRSFKPDGTLNWFILVHGVVNSSPAIASDGTIYVGAIDLYAINPDSTVKWHYHTAGSVPSSPAIAADGTIYFGSTDHYLYALNPDGSLKWRYLTDGNVESSPVIAHDGTIYVGSVDNYVYALKPDGTIKWKYGTQAPIHASPAVAADGVVYIGSDDNSLYALYPDGTLKWKYETGGNVEAATTIGTDGTIYFVSYDGYLYALKGTSPLADSPWPKFHHDLKNSGRVGGGK